MSDPDPDPETPVSRAEFQALQGHVANLERRLAAITATLEPLGRALQNFAVIFGAEPSRPLAAEVAAGQPNQPA